MKEFTEEQIQSTVEQNYQSVTARKLSQVWNELKKCRKDKEEKYILWQDKNRKQSKELEQAKERNSKLNDIVQGELKQKTQELERLKGDYQLLMDDQEIKARLIKELEQLKEDIREYFGCPPKQLSPTMQKNIETYHPQIWKALNPKSDHRAKNGE